MGMTGAEWALLGGSLGGNALASLTAPDGQEIRSFFDDPNDEIAPSVLLDQLKEMLVNFRDPLWNRINRGNSLPNAIVQQPPVFDGGGMPMPVGLAAFDPAAANPDLLSSQSHWTDDPGGDVVDRTFPPGGGGSGGGSGRPRNGDPSSGGYGGSTNPSNDGNSIPDIYDNAPWWYPGAENDFPPWFTPPRQAATARSAASTQPGESGTDDLSSALGAADLLTALHGAPAQTDAGTAGGPPRRRTFRSLPG